MSALIPTSELLHVCDLALALESGRLSGLIPTSTSKLRLVRGPEFEFPEDLIGFTPPNDWHGVVLAATGRATLLEPDHGRPFVAPVEVAFAVDRSGRSGAITRSADGAIDLADLSDGDNDSGGLVVDVCRRVLRLPTPPETVGLIRLEHQGWLLFLLETVDAASMTGWADDWDLVALSHPMALDSPTTEPSVLGSTLWSAYHGADWSRLHAAVVASDHRWDDLDPDQVAWLDAGSFARYVLESRPALGELLDALRPSVTDDVFASVLAAIEWAGDIFDSISEHRRPSAPAG
jgi:hypothetical protein